tara:strand:+ start:330 stop:1175 length:846 start_codon:yes stop_codon:yes gene_type:complete
VGEYPDKRNSLTWATFRKIEKTMAKREKPPEFIDIALYWDNKGLITLDDESLIHPMVDYGEPSCQGCRSWHISTNFGEFKSGDDKYNKDLANKRWNYSGFEKAHIIAHEYGGSDTDPSNFLILCRSCHYDFDKEVYIADKDDIDEVYYWLRDRPQIAGKRKQRYIEKFVKDNNIAKHLNKFIIATGIVSGNLSKDLNSLDHYLSQEEEENIYSYLKRAKVKSGSKILEKQIRCTLELSFAVMNTLLAGDEFNFLDEQEDYWSNADILKRLLKQREKENSNG